MQQSIPIIQYHNMGFRKALMGLLVFTLIQTTDLQTEWADFFFYMWVALVAIA